ncbi:MAG: flavodoxin family protein [Treponema sp.]|jgi:multimeric flavodoxin WrbA|nr:flavodoxin family protein [Treponema sp.]
MKVIAVNGSPRKNWNTHILLEKCLDGAKTAGADAELINLYDINFKGCVSCFACKLKGITVKKCAFKDELESILQKVCECDALILGSPVYLYSVTGEMKSFMERLLFPYISYEGKPSSFGKKIKTAFIYTMNSPSFGLPFNGYNKYFNENKKLVKRIFGSSVSLAVTSTYQFDDYSKYAMTFFDGAKRLKRRETVFVKDCEKAFELGKSLIKQE